MPAEASCKQTIEITVPAAEVAQETERAVNALREKVRLPGFRPGKVPADLVRSRFAGDVREDVIRSLVPKHFQQRAEELSLKVVGTPDVRDVHFHAGEPLTFKADFEVLPEFELMDYSSLSAPYRQPEVTEEQVAQRLGELREQKAEFVNEEPRPAVDGDYAVAALTRQGEHDASAGKEEQVVVVIGGEDTLEAFSANLRGLSPGEVKEFEVAYPDDYGEASLAGHSVRFHARLEAIRRKELPELNDEFAKDLGDFQTLEELRGEVRQALEREQESQAQLEAKGKLVEQLVGMHEFPVPEAFVDRQVQNRLEQYLRGLAARGADIENLKLDWAKIKESQKEAATREVKASLLLDRIADRENIGVTNEEVDREVKHLAQQSRQVVAVVRQRLEKEGALGRIASRIRNEKTLNFLFEHSRKVAED
jgi:trigger factor